MVIGISGKISSGKDTIAKMIQYFTEYKNNGYLDFNNFLECYDENKINENSIWKIKKNAGKLKEIISLMLGIPLKDLEKEEVKNRLLPDKWQVYHIKCSGLGLAAEKTIDVFFEDIKKANQYCINRSSSYTTYSYYKSQRTVRWLMQYIGTELFRDRLHRDVHINMLYANYYLSERSQIPNSVEEYNHFPNWLITDVRFHNEINPIQKRNGFVIRVNRKIYYWKDKDKKFVTTTPFIEEYKGLESDLYSRDHPSETSLDDYKGFKYIVDNNGTLLELYKQVEEICIKENLI